MSRFIRTGYAYSRLIHRYLTLATALITLVMVATGIILKYDEWAYNTGIDIELARHVHDFFTPLAAFCFGMMAITGVYMYFYPMWVKSRSKKV